MFTPTHFRRACLGLSLVFSVGACEFATGGLENRILRDGAAADSGIGDGSVADAADEDARPAPPDGNVPPDSGTATDAEADGGLDDAGGPDAEVLRDARVDPPVDAQADAPHDAQVDAPVDAQADAPHDAQVDAPVDAQADAPHDAQVDAPVDAQVDAPSQDADMEGEGGPTGCDLSGRFAVRMVARARWEPRTFLGFVTLVAGGEGDLRMTVSVDLDQDGNTLTGPMRVCDVQIPAFSAPVVDDTYIGYFDTDLWTAQEMPRPPLSVQLGCTQPGCSVSSDPFYVQLGLALDPPDAPWPEERESLPFVDHDGDGVPGIVLTFLGPDRADSTYPLLDYPALNYSASRRAREVSMGTHVAGQLAGSLQSCDEFSGFVPGLDVRAAASDCTRENGSPCTSGDVRFVDNNFPTWITQSSRYTARRVAADANCAQVRAAVADD